MQKLIIILSIVFITQPAAAIIMDLDTIVISAARLEQEGSRVAGNVSVITKDKIESSNAQSVPDLLQQVEGVFVYDTSTSKTSVVDIRGFGDSASRNVLVLVDGRRLNVADSGGADLTNIPIGAVERIEVIRGGSSVLYGDNAVGGVVNIITKKGEGKLSGKVGAYYGSWDQQGGDLQIQGEEKGLSYYIYRKYSDKRGYREQSDEFYNNTNVRFDYELNEKIQMGVQYGFSEDNYELPGGLNTLTNELFLESRRGSADNEAGNVADSEDQYVKFFFDIDPLPENMHLGHFVIDATWRERKTFDIFGQFNFRTNRDVETKGITVKYIYDREILDRKVDFIVGLDVYEHESLIFGSGTNSDDLTISKDELGKFVQLQFEVIEDLYFVGGSRYQDVVFTFDQRSGTPNFLKEKPDDWVHSGGLKYEYAQGSNLFFNFQETFRYLTPNEWYSSFSGLNTNLKQQTGEQYEIGIKHNFNGRAVVSLTPYWMETENEIFFDPSLGFFGSNSNYDTIERFGVELSSKVDVLAYFPEVWSFIDRIDYFANYTYQDAEFAAGSNEGKKVPFVPNHQVNTGFMVGLFDHYNVSLIGRYVGERYAINDTANTLSKARDYIVTDLKLSYDRKNFEAYVAVNNLFDVKYDTYNATNANQTVRDIYPAPEKNVLAGVNLKF